MAIQLSQIKPIITKAINDTEKFISPSTIITEIKPAIENVSTYFSPSTPIGAIKTLEEKTSSTVMKPTLYFWA